MGYNPINGEAYSTKENVKAKVETNEKPADVPANTTQQENNTVQETPTAPTQQESNTVQETPAASTEKNNTKKPDDTKDANNAQTVIQNSYGNFIMFFCFRVCIQAFVYFILQVVNQAVHFGK